MFNVFSSTLRYELLLFFRCRRTFLHSLGFFVIITALFPIALSPHPELLRPFAPVILWIAALLAHLLALENWLRTDVEEYALEQLLLSSFPLPWLITAKMLAFWITVTLPLLLITPLLGLFLHLSWLEIFILCLSLLSGTPAFISIGATCKSLAISLQQQGALMGLLVLPLTLPILIMGVNTLAFAQITPSVIGNLAFLSGISLLCFALLPWAIAYALRWGQE